MIKLIKEKIAVLEAESAELDEIFGEDWEEFDASDGGNFDDTYEMGREHGELFGELGILYKLLAEAEKVEKEHLDVKIQLSDAESLLYDARSLMNDVHCYNSEVYRNIGTFLYGDEEDEEYEEDDE